MNYFIWIRGKKFIKQNLISLFGIGCKFRSVSTTCTEV